MDTTLVNRESITFSTQKPEALLGIIAISNPYNSWINLSRQNPPYHPRLPHQQ